VSAVVLVGMAVAVWCAGTLVHNGVPKEWLVFVVLMVGAGRLTLKVPSVEASFSVSELIGFTSVMLFGYEAVALALALDSLLLSWLRRLRPQQALFNFANLALSASLSGVLFFKLSGVGPLYGATGSLDALVLPLAIMVAAYFGLNSGLIAVAIALQSRGRPWRIWRTHFMWLGPGYAAAGSIALLLVIALKEVPFSALLVLPPVLVVSFLMVRSSFGRVEDAKAHVERVNGLYLSTIESLATAIDAKDETTHGHVRRVQGAAVALARELGVVDDDTIRAIEAAALLHDAGKIAIPEHILNKPGRLTDAEFEQMKMHAPIGAEILSSIQFPYPVIPIVRHHHENWDGSGYPDGLRGTDIPIGARILSVVDCFDALTSDRPYRRRMSDEHALAIVIERRGTMYDPVIVDTFVRTYKHVMPPADAPPHPAAQAVGGVRAAMPLPAAATAPTAPDVPISEDMLAFSSLARAARGEAEAQDLMALAWMLLRELVPCAGAAVFTYDEADDVMIATAAAGPHANLLRQLRYRMAIGPVGWVAVNRRTLVNGAAAVASAGVDVPLTSALALPLSHEGSFAGVICLYSDGTFSDNHARMIELLAPRLGAMFAEAAAPRRAARQLTLVRGAGR
jgi:putative nucleotidyltransferase with HDIG domain